MKRVGILLAAGQGQRMGGPVSKLLLPVGSEQLVQRSLRPFLDSSLDSVMVVVGHVGDRVAEALPADPRLRVIVNPDWQSGLGTSLAAAVASLEADTDQVLVGLGDMPWIPTDVIELILAQPSERSIVAPCFDGKRGHPVRFSRRWFGELSRLAGDRGAGGLLERNPDAVTLVAVGEPGILRDVDRPEQVPQQLPRVVLRGGGDLASGAAHRLYTSGFPVLILELPEPRMLRGTVSFSEAVYRGQWTVEGVTARRFSRPPCDWRSYLPVVVDEAAACLSSLGAEVLVDARVLKHPGDLRMDQAPFVVALGPGIKAGLACHAVVETNRGPNIGSVLTAGLAEADTGVPGLLGGETFRRVVRAPCHGVFRRTLELGATVQAGDELATVDGVPVLSQLDGLLRGLLHSGISVEQGDKVADVDPRPDSNLLQISDKARAVGKGVEAAIRQWMVDR